MNRLTKTLSVLLGVSVVLNALLLGFWGGRLIGRREVRGEVAAPSGDAPSPMRGMFRRHRLALRAESDALERARRRVTEALVAEPFRPEALESALADLRAETGGAQVAMHRVLVDTARDMSVEERQQIARSRWLGGARPSGPHGEN